MRQRRVAVRVVTTVAALLMVAGVSINLALDSRFFAHRFAISVLIGVAAWHAARHAMTGNVHALILFSSLAGFILIALLGSLLDAPRLTLLVYLLIAAALLLPWQRVRTGANLSTEQCNAESPQSTTTQVPKPTCGAGLMQYAG